MFSQRLTVVVAAVVLAGWAGAARAGELHDRAAAGDVSGVKALLDAGTDVNDRTARGETALHRAVVAGDAGVVGILLASGAEPSAADRYGLTPLHLVAEAGNADRKSVV